MNHLRRYAPVLLVLLCGPAWISYEDKVERAEPVFGKAFVGMSLKVSTENVEILQETPEKVVVELRNQTDRTTLMPGEPAPGRIYRLHLILADKNDRSLFSKDILSTAPDNAVNTGGLPAQTSTALCTVPFDSIEVAAVKEFENGMPYFDPKNRLVPTSKLSPQLFILKAVLFSAKDADSRPDFMIASEAWPILLLPPDPATLSQEEKKTRLAEYLAKLKRNAYGGQAVSSQLAALGEMGVDPLIQIADRPGAGARESRIWAIVTLCNTGSAKAEEYILRRLHDPVDFGDLAFLAWHSQGFGSERVTQALRDLAETIANQEPMPWEERHGPDSRSAGLGCLEFICKHFVSVKKSVTDRTVTGALSLEDPKPVTFVILAWTPESPESCARAVLPLFFRPLVHPNLRKAVLGKLSEACQPLGFPPYDREANVNRQWLQATTWLVGKGWLPVGRRVEALRALVLSVKDPAVQQDLLASFRRAAGDQAPARGSTLMPDAWIATWRWALETGGVEDDQAVQFLCGQMRTRDELDPKVKTALLLELKRVLGEPFPLPPGEVDLDEAWPTCGKWLVDQGYFGTPGG